MINREAYDDSILNYDGEQDDRLTSFDTDWQVDENEELGELSDYPALDDGYSD